MVVNSILRDAQAILADMQRLADQARQVEKASAQPDEEKKNFADVLNQAMTQVRTMQDHAVSLPNERHSPVQTANLSSLLLASQPTPLAMEAMVEIRNRAIQAYKDIESMQV